MTAPLILIRTRPLGEGNYGGILQAYAMQQLLIGRGFRAVTDTSRAEIGASRPRLLQVTQTIKTVASYGRVPGLTKQRWVDQAIRPRRDQRLSEFIDRNIRTARIIGEDGVIDRELLGQVQGFLVGSDQVWRARYGRVPSYLLDFLDPGDGRRRIAYAASFGVDNLDEFSQELLDRTRELAQKFDAVSVRELSGTELCQQAWSVHAVPVLDPTLLIERGHYMELANSSAPARGEGGLVKYLLDPSDQVGSAIAASPRLNALRPTNLLPAPPRSVLEYKRRPDRYERPGVEEWLASIARADFVVTDSFHGMVFSIIFNRPFAVVVNHERGAARFASLLSQLGLEDRIAKPGSGDMDRLAVRSVDWGSVNGRLEELRSKSNAFLDGALLGLDGATGPGEPAGVRA